MEHREYADNVHDTYSSMVQQVRLVQAREAQRMVWFVGIAGFVIFATPEFVARVWPRVPTQHYLVLWIAPFAAAVFAALWAALALDSDMHAGEEWWLRVFAKINAVRAIPVDDHDQGEAALRALLAFLADDTPPKPRGTLPTRVATWALIAAFGVATLAAIAWTLTP